MLVAAAGPWLCIAGGVYARKPIVQPLTDFLWTGARPLGNSDQTRLERIFFSLRKLLKSLDHHYSVTVPQNASDLGGYPTICEYEGRTFTYEKRLDPHNTEKQVFKVKEGSEYRVVKFASQYNEDAHRLLAKEVNGESFAPALHHVSSRLYGGRRIVVMDYVEGQTALEVKGISNDHYKQLERAIKRLHEVGLVFGDLREPNILISGGKVKLVDFDWCGQDNKAKYPKDLNVKTIEWAEGVGPRKVMTKDHDLAMLKKLLHKPKPKSE